MERKKVIAIDGYSSCGKSTFAKAIAQKLGYVFIDTGAMYRTVTLFALENGIDPEKLTDNLDKIDIEFIYSEKLGRGEVYLNGENVDSKIRTSEVNGMVSAVAQVSEVRQKLVQLQRKMGERGGVVMDGRDIGTVVFPDADLKIFMTAGVDIRAKRRYDEMGGEEAGVDLAQITKNISERDYLDENREDSPLRKASDALLLDNSDMTPEEQMVFIENYL